MNMPKITVRMSVGMEVGIYIPVYLLYSIKHLEILNLLSVMMEARMIHLFF